MQLPSPFQNAYNVLDTIEQYGYEAYFVGGCVRDLLLGRNIGDIDIASSAKPNDIQQLFKKVIPVGLEHGTVIVRYQQQSYEVTTFRMESDYSDKRHPDFVQFVQTIKQDLQRRDFTINALAMDKSGKLSDPFNGGKDLEKHLIRTVGDSYERFQEDPLRILRALRFSSQLGFRIEAKTLKAMTALSTDIKSIAMERIVEETAKFFAGDYINTGIDYFKVTAIADHLPILQDYPYIIDKLPAHMKPLASFAAVIALFYMLAPVVTVQDWAKQWKCSNHTKQQASILVTSLSYYREQGLDHWLVYRLCADCYRDFTILVNVLFTDHLTEETVQKVRASLPIHSKQDLAVDGTDIRQLFPDRQAGRWIGVTLDELEKRVVTGRLSNNQQTLKEWLNWHPPDFI